MKRKKNSSFTQDQWPYAQNTTYKAMALCLNKYVIIGSKDKFEQKAMKLENTIVLDVKELLTDCDMPQYQRFK